MSAADRGLHGAVAAGWIEEQAPDPVQPLLFDILDSWQADPAQPPPALWHSLTQCLRAQGCLDAELSAWEALLNLAPNEPAILARIAEVEHLRGRPGAARDALAKVPPHHPSRAAALLLRMELADSTLDERAACAAELEPLLAARTSWDSTCHGFVRRLVEAGMAERAKAFLAAWTQARPPGAEAGSLMELGWLAMHCGDAPGARALFQRLWGLDDPAITQVAGRFDGTIPPYSPEIEDGIKARIEAAFALPEDALSRVPLPDAAPKAAKVLFAGFDRLAMPNDMAEHFLRSGRAAGVEIKAWLDSAIVFPQDFRGTDEEVEARVQAFEAELERSRPDVLILDCAYFPSQRGLNPARVRALADRLGFRLIGMMRDALESCMTYLEAWGAACDRLLIFDPCSPLLDHPTLKAKTVVGLTPAQHLERSVASRDLGLLFVGASAYGVRNMLLSVLTTEDIPFTAVTGPKRAELAPDMDSYAGLLGRARAVLNVAAHSRSEFLVTGRVFETIAKGAVLIEQDNPATARFLTPWRHYLPWRDVADIVHLTRFVETNPETTKRIADAARDWLDRNYNCRRFWAAVLAD